MSPPPSFAARHRPSPPTPVNQKNTPSTATFVRRCADVSLLSTMMAKARWAKMIATDDNDDGDGATGKADNGNGATGDGATGYDDDDDDDW
jgi:hypothetical protein